MTFFRAGENQDGGKSEYEGKQEFHADVGLAVGYRAM